MATDLPETGDDVGQKGRNLELFEANLKKIEDLTTRLVAVMGKRRKVPQSGLTTMRAKLRSVTSPQALTHSTRGLPVAAMIG